MIHFLHSTANLICGLKTLRLGMRLLIYMFMFRLASHAFSHSSDPQRYFSQGERQRSRTAEDKVRERPSDVGTWLQLAGGASGHGKALGYLEEGLKNTASSEVCGSLVCDGA